MLHTHTYTHRSCLKGIKHVCMYVCMHVCIHYIYIYIYIVYDPGSAASPPSCGSVRFRVWVCLECSSPALWRGVVRSLSPPLMFGISLSPYHQYHHHHQWFGFWVGFGGASCPALRCGVVQRLGPLAAPAFPYSDVVRSPTYRIMGPSN